MKLILVAAMVGAAAPLFAAKAAILTLGGPMSQLCYQSAVGEDGRSSAVESCNRALAEESLSTRDKASTYVNRGIVLMSAARFDEADQDFDMALKLEQNLPDVWLNKGFLRLRQGDGRDALVLIQRAIDQGASNKALALFGRGVAHEQMGDVRAAYADLTRAHALAPHWILPRDYLSRYRVAER